VARPLIDPAWRARALWVCGVAAVAFAVLAAWVSGRRSTVFDTWAFRELYAHTSINVAVTMLGFSAPAVSISTCAIIVLAAVLMRRWDVAALAALAPTVTMMLTEWVFKPLFGRELAVGDFHVTGVFPSGHESAVAATALVLVVLSFQVALSRRARAVLLGVIALWVLVAAVGLVRNLWHFPTDTIGSVLLATVIVLGLALMIDRYWATVVRRVERRSGRQLTRRS
jgi:hypothetical protein